MICRFRMSRMRELYNLQREKVEQTKMIRFSYYERIYYLVVMKEEIFYNKHYKNSRKQMISMIIKKINNCRLSFFLLDKMNLIILINNLKFHNKLTLTIKILVQLTNKTINNTHLILLILLLQKKAILFLIPKLNKKTKIKFKLIINFINQLLYKI